MGGTYFALGDLRVGEDEKGPMCPLRSYLRRPLLKRRAERLQGRRGGPLRRPVPSHGSAHASSSRSPRTTAPRRVRAPEARTVACPTRARLRGETRRQAMGALPKTIRLSRRDLVKLGFGVAGAAALGEIAGPRAARAEDPPPTPIRFTPFTRELPIPPTLAPAAPFATDCQFDTGVAPNFYTVLMRKAFTEIIPGVQTEIWGYEGLYPGPTIRGRMGRPDVVRQVNGLDVETSVHQHGGHNPSNSDGLPFQDQLIFPGNFKDYCYPNAPAGCRPGAGGPDDKPTHGRHHRPPTDNTGPNRLHRPAG